MNAHLRLEAFNVFNHPNFGNPDTSLSSPMFGRSATMLNQFLGTGGPSSGFGFLRSRLAGPRSLQIALRLRL